MSSIDNVEKNGTNSAPGSTVHDAIGRAAAAAHPAVDRVSLGAHHTVDALAAAANNAAGQVENSGAQLHDLERRFAARCRRQMTEQPFATLGIAVASGFLLSWLLRAR